MERSTTDILISWAVERLRFELMNIYFPHTCGGELCNAHPAHVWLKDKWVPIS